MPLAFDPKEMGVIWACVVVDWSQTTSEPDGTEVISVWVVVNSLMVCRETGQLIKPADMQPRPV
jgi:hypothetical protein